MISRELGGRGREDGGRGVGGLDRDGVEGREGEGW